MNLRPHRTSRKKQTTRAQKEQNPNVSLKNSESDQTSKQTHLISRRGEAKNAGADLTYQLSPPTLAAPLQRRTSKSQPNPPAGTQSLTTSPRDSTAGSSARPPDVGLGHFGCGGLWFQLPSGYYLTRLLRGGRRRRERPGTLKKDELGRSNR